jgi:hypothetical protein
MTFSFGYLNLKYPFSSEKLQSPGFLMLTESGLTLPIVANPRFDLKMIEL